jgi:hypothetical protein
MKPLNPPPSAESDPNATELLRSWSVNKQLDVVIKIGVFQERDIDEAVAWGMVVSDFTRHVARALSQRFEKNEEQEMAKIRDSFLRELEQPTSPITGE